MMFPERIAVVGASGFVGSRVVEMFHLQKRTAVRAIVRSVNGLSRISRFDMDWRIADARDVSALSAALEGCDAVVHAVVGDPKAIEAAAAALYPAAVRAGVRRIVYLSTASVHGQNPEPGTSEISTISDSQRVPYNNAKVRAERVLLEQRQMGTVELVLLRPSIVFGPRDRWVPPLIQDLRARRAWLINQGSGVCNTIYVDNLVEAIRLTLSAPAAKVDREAFLVGDEERVTWAQFYTAVCAGTGIAVDSIHHIERPNFPPPSFRERLDNLRCSELVQALLPRIPAGLKRAAKGALKGFGEQPPENGWKVSCSPTANPTLEMLDLQSCSLKLPIVKARERLEYVPLVTFEEGMRRTLAWYQWRESTGGK